jgi:hypothetical protein
MLEHPEQNPFQALWIVFRKKLVLIRKLPEKSCHLVFLALWGVVKETLKKLKNAKSVQHFCLLALQREQE